MPASAEPVNVSVRSTCEEVFCSVSAVTVTRVPLASPSPTAVVSDDSVSCGRSSSVRLMSAWVTLKPVRAPSTRMVSMDSESVSLLGVTLNVSECDNDSAGIVIVPRAMGSVTAVTALSAKSFSR